ncbi:MAG: hypothetical protein EXS50_00845 [Candidatus Taylorbacteria bacterium]|nr:hypothetical protein [Candidatus Taylorbacteria bacterium]
MFTPCIQSKFVEKILTNVNGEQFRVTFFVSLVAGEIKAQVVSAECISKTVEAKKILCLPEFYAKQVQDFIYAPSCAPILSPFNQFFFFNSQPTRAPSF